MQGAKVVLRNGEKALTCDKVSKVNTSMAISLRGRPLRKSPILAFSNDCMFQGSLVVKMKTTIMFCQQK